MLTLSSLQQTSKNSPSEEPAHSGLGPSASERWLNCPGSVLATANLPEQDSTYAMEGTAAHTLSEWCRKRNKPASAFRGQHIPVVSQETGDAVAFEATQVMVDAVQEFIDYVNELPGEAFIEERVNFDAWVPEGFGTLDDLRLEEGMAYLTDFKYGQGVQVYAKDNTQLLCYALGVYQEFGSLYDIDTFQLNIHQPRLNHVDEWTVTLKDVLLWAKNVAKPGALAALEPGAPFSAGSWCQFCKLKHSCKTRAQSVFDTVIDEFEEISAATEMTLDELSGALERVSEIRKWCNDIEARALSEIQRGNNVGHWKLVAGRARRIYKTAEDAVEKRLRAEKLKVGQIFTKKLVSPAQLEKIVGKKHPLMEELVERTPGAPVLVPGSDPRPALAYNADEEFPDEVDDS